MPPERDLAAFEARAASYEQGWRGRLHHDIADKTADLSVLTRPDPRRILDVGCGTEHLPFPDRTFDLVVSTTSFDHWSDQQAGLRECARVLTPGGSLVLVDQFSLWLSPTLISSRHGKARTERRANRILRVAGFSSLAWHPLYAVIIKAVTATT